MSRKDTILIAVIVNAGLLAILFVTAVIYDTDKLIEHSGLETTLAEAGPVKIHSPLKNYIDPSHPTVDEMDNELKNYMEPFVPTMQEEELNFNDPVQEPILFTPSQNSDTANIFVKKGDTLEKIARANQTSVEALKKINHLNNEKLSIGQQLKLPSKENQVVANAAPIAQPKNLPSPPPVNTASNEAVYHIIKSGDSPWKIAKQYGVNYEQILKLNKLDEDKARNLKIGERIRVK